MSNSEKPIWDGYVPLTKTELAQAYLEINCYRGNWTPATHIALTAAFSMAEQSILYAEEIQRLRASALPFKHHIPRKTEAQLASDVKKAMDKAFNKGMDSALSRDSTTHNAESEGLIASVAAGFAKVLAQLQSQPKP